MQAYKLIRKKKKSSKILSLQNATNYVLQIFIWHRQIKTNPLLQEEGDHFSDKVTSCTAPMLF